MSYDRWKLVTEGDPPIEGAHGSIQWKGTQACMDLYCDCGYHGHVDSSEFFFYNYICANCGVAYALSHQIRLIKLTPEQRKEESDGGLGFYVDDDMDPEYQGMLIPEAQTTAKDNTWRGVRLLNKWARKALYGY